MEQRLKIQKELQEMDNEKYETNYFTYIESDLNYL